jgi:hypothetical protein
MVHSSRNVMALCSHSLTHVLIVLHATPCGLQLLLLRLIAGDQLL